MKRRPTKKTRQVLPLKEREAARLKQREDDRERLRAEKFRLAKEDNPYHGTTKKRRRMGKILLFPGAQILVSKDTIYHKYVQSFKNFPWFKLTVTFLLILLGGIGSAMFQARNANIRTEISSVERELRDLHADIFRREAELRERYTFEEIERAATERLGMAFPDASQIIHINVPRIGGVTLNTAEYALPRHNYFWEDVRNFMSGIVDQIFGG